VADWSAEENNPLLADDRNFYKVEKWSKDNQRVESTVGRQLTRQGARNLQCRSQAAAAHSAPADAGAAALAVDLTLFITSHSGQW
jgi:hypothetical protein